MAMMRRVVDDHFRRQENKIRRLLGLWVSGLEPEIIYDHRTLEVLGLTFAGFEIGSTPPVVIEAETL